MSEAPAIVTDADMDRLTRLVRAFKHSLFRDQKQLDLLDQTLAAAEVRCPERVPKDVIRMNSRVRVFDFDKQSRGLYTLTFPEEADVSKNMISVLAPLGIALLGRRKGDVIEAQVPGGVRKLRVERVQATVSRTSVSKRDPARNASKVPPRHEAALSV
jgi:regulator of nucleoside diphosphate kinase